MEKQKYHYDAFISYRHTDLDKFVAENIHKQLEAYRMPADVAGKRPGMKNKVERVFRDQEELPLTSDLNDPIMTALHNSDWLIVICSPRLRDSIWCKKEIETFIQLNGREKVLAVLIEGEPSESFPEELLFKTEKITKPDGTVEEVQIPVEPLAADVRGKNKKEVLKNLKLERLRILAAIFHVNFDDLRQRHKEQRMKRIMTASIAGGMACLLFAVFCIFVALRINEQKITIQGLADQVMEQHEELKTDQAEALAESAMRYLENGDRESAVKISLQALTNYDDLSMPYTPEAQYALAESLRAYDTGEVLRAQYQFETMGIIQQVEVAPNQKTILIVDDSETVTLYDTEAKEVILELYKGEHIITQDKGYAFLANNRLAYINGSNEAVIFNMESRQVEEIIANMYVFNMISDPEGNYLALADLYDDYYIYDGNTLELQGKMPDIAIAGMDQSSINTEGILAYALGGTTGYEIHFIDCKTQQVISSLEIKDVFVEEIIVEGNRAYALASHYSDNLTETQCLVYAIDVQTGEILWENSQSGCTAMIMLLPACERKEELLVLSNYTARLVDLETGEAGFQIPLDNYPVMATASQGENAFEFLRTDGSITVLTSEYDFDVRLDKMLDCKTDNNIDYCYVNGGLVVVPIQSNRLTIYTTQKAEAVEVSSITEIEQPACYYDEAAQDIAGEYGLDRPEFISTLFFDPDRNLAFISYWNEDFVVYDVVTNTVLATLEDCDTMCGYWAQDYEGNIYLQGYKGGYILSKDMKIKMFIPNMIGVDVEQNKVYLKGVNNLYEAPIYSSEDLIQMAAPYMDAEETEKSEEPDSNEEN